jgi:transcription elongation factor Elf1
MENKELSFFKCESCEKIKEFSRLRLISCRIKIGTKFETITCQICPDCLDIDEKKIFKDILVSIGTMISNVHQGQYSVLIDSLYSLKTRVITALSNKEG